MFYNQDWTYYAQNFYTTTKYPLTNFWLFHLIPSLTPSGGLVLYLTLQAFLLVLAYATVKPVTVTKEITRARVAWIVFGVLYVVRWLINRLDISEIVQGLITPQAFEFLEFLAIVILMVIVALYPETLLITKSQLLQANRLYSIVTDIDSQPKDSIFDYNTRIQTYLQKLPPELKKEIRLQ
jgi:hypothetical protein